MHAQNSYYVDVLLMKMIPNDWNRSWNNENNEFLLDMCSTDETDDSSNSICIDSSNDKLEAEMIAVNVSGASDKTAGVTK